MRSLVLFALFLGQYGCTSSSISGSSPLNDGVGWRTIHLDLKVDISMDRAPLVIAEILLRLDDSIQSHGPSLMLNSLGGTSTFRDFQVPGHEVTRNVRDEDGAPTLYAHIRRDATYERGDTLRLSIPIVLEENRSLLHYWSRDFVLVSWVNVWYPAPVDPSSGPSWQTMKAPGSTTFEVPKDWTVVSSGTENSSQMVGERKRVLYSNDGSVARSFAAGPFRSVHYDLPSGDTLDVVGTRNIAGQQVRVEAFLSSIRLLEELFGAAPYKYHSIVEVPYDVPGFYGASEQNFILLKTQAFDDPLNSLPVLAHEAAHAWWAIAVGVELEGQGTLFMTESMAQYSAVLAIEKVHGAKAAKDFMWSGVGGFSPNHDAQAFFRFYDEGRDMPLITKRLGETIQHYLADSKGTWVYHMLRKKIGDDAFFSALQEIVATYSNRNITLREWCRIFNDQTPHDLTQFFRQWLEWEGAPEISIAFSEDRKGAIISQLQEEGIYDLDLELLIKYEDGANETRKLRFDKRRTSITSSSGVAITEIIVDPHRDLLIRR